MSDVNLPVLPPREERRRRSDRRSSDPAKRDRRRPSTSAWTGTERRRGPRRVFDRRQQNVLRALLATLLCMLCLAAPPDLQADNSEPCLKPAVTLEFYGRAQEAKEFSLARCDGTPNMSVLDAFSVHVRPRGAEPDAPLGPDEDASFVARDVRRFDARVLLRLQEVAERWPGNRIIVVSAYRPGARDGSRHHHAQAIDIRVEGIHRAEVAEFARALPETGVGYYPSSTFTHIDVRNRPSFWVDASEPGQRSRYIPDDEEEAFFAAALAELPSRSALAAALPVVIEGPEPAVLPADGNPASATTSVQNPALRRDVQRTLQEGLRGAFDVPPSAPAPTRSAANTPAVVIASPDAPGASSAPPTPRSPGPSMVAPASSTPSSTSSSSTGSAPIDWSAPW